MKNSQPFHPLACFPRHPPPARSSPQPRQLALTVPFRRVPASVLGQAGPLGCPGVFCPPLVQQPPGDPLLRGRLWGELQVKTAAVSGWEKWADEASPSTCQSIKLSTQTSGRPWKPSAVICTNTVIFPRCCLREAGPRCYLLNNYPVSQGQSSPQLLHRGPGGRLRRLLGAALCHWQLTEHIEMAVSRVPTTKKDNCIKGWFYFFPQFFIRWKRIGEPQRSKASITTILLPFLFVVLMPPVIKLRWMIWCEFVPHDMWRFQMFGSDSAMSALCTYDAQGRGLLIKVISCSDTRMHMLIFPLSFQFIVSNVTKGLMTSRASFSSHTVDMDIKHTVIDLSWFITE